MVMMVKCPGCAVALNVPKRAAGHWARCPACRSTFIVPRDDELLDETASVWIEQSVESEHRRRHAISAMRMARLTRQLMATATATAAAGPGTAAGSEGYSGDDPAKDGPGGGVREQSEVPELEMDEPVGEIPEDSARRVAKGGATAATAHGAEQEDDGEIAPGQASPMDDSMLGDLIDLDDPDDGERPTLSDSQVSVSPGQTDPGPQGLAPSPPQAGEQDGTAATSATKAGAGKRDEDEADPAVAAERAQREDTGGMADAGGHIAAAGADELVPPPMRLARSGSGLQYPGEIDGAARPYLIVTEATQAGVTLAFNARWMEHPRFRASLPLQCVFSNEVEPGSLLARPLAFIDRTQAQVRSLDALDARYEYPLHEYQTVDDLIGIMGRIEELPAPFNLPMPYYVARRYKHDTLQTWTEKRRDGTIDCYVTIPSARCAMAWVARVNGICGDEYELLAEQVMLSEDDAWRELSDPVRKRISVWCAFESRERFVAYIPDADFGCREAGLAGIVVTDRRVLHHKYHHNAQVRRDESVTLFARQKGPVTTLILARGEDRSRFGKVLNDHLKDLVEAIGPDSQIKVVFSG